MSMFHNGFMHVPSVPNQPKTAEIPAKTHPKCIKNTHGGNHKLKNFSGEIPRTPLTRGGIPPLALSPTRAFGTCSDLRRTPNKYVATGLFLVHTRALATGILNLSAQCRDVEHCMKIFDTKKIFFDKITAF